MKLKVGLVYLIINQIHIKLKQQFLIEPGMHILQI